jgi:hypothetical protein
MYKVIAKTAEDTDSYRVGDIIRCRLTRGIDTDFTMDFMVVTAENYKGRLLVIQDLGFIGIGKMGEVWNFKTFDFRHYDMTVTYSQLLDYLEAKTLKVTRITELHLT